MAQDLRGANRLLRFAELVISLYDHTVCVTAPNDDDVCWAYLVLSGPFLHSSSSRLGIDVVQQLMIWLKTKLLIQTDRVSTEPLTRLDRQREENLELLFHLGRFCQTLS